MSTVMMEEERKTIAPVSDGMLSLQEVMAYLELEKTGVEELVKKDKLNAYKIGGIYLRFKKDEVLGLKSDLIHEEKTDNPALEKLHDFWAYNNFYIITGFCLLILLYFALR